jgi:hypothetical protein
MYNEVERLVELIQSYKNEKDMSLLTSAAYAKDFAEAAENLVRKVAEKDRTIGRLVTRVLA